MPNPSTLIPCILLRNGGPWGCVGNLWSLKVASRTFGGLWGCVDNLRSLNVASRTFGGLWNHPGEGTTAFRSHRCRQLLNVYTRLYEDTCHWFVGVLAP